ncbi:MAG: Polyketide cyclase/dehydrase [Gemmatimonadetes bacterium]|jgi:ribosome-associated toxin RatA of RatAB toxin-antitoxin module|nr:Polyketide cyclase/dehydrase [Gemmatimonadota bacterium]
MTGQEIIATRFDLGPMPDRRGMRTLDEQLVRAPLERIFALAAGVERWPAVLPHYRFVRFQERRGDGGGIVDMSASRPFGVLQWPTWWRSRMSVRTPGEPGGPSLRFTHIAGVTTGMEVEWSFEPTGGDTHVRILHLWDGPPIPVVGALAASLLIGPVFVHGIASRTLAGLAAAAERAP